MGKLRPENHGPTLTNAATTAIVAGTTSGYEEYAAFGPIQIVADTVFNTACVMASGGGDKPDTGTTYPAGLTLYKYFTTIQIDSGTIEMAGQKDLKELGL